MQHDCEKEEHSDWKIILADEYSRQVVLYNSVLEELQVRPPTTVTLNSSLKCSLCNRPFLSEPAYFTFLHSHHQATSTPLLASDTSNSPLGGIPKSTFDEGYYTRFFREVKKLGRGAGGSVFHCQHVLNATPLGSYAVKKIPVGDDPKWLSKMLREAQVLSEISKHPNVIDYKHCWLETWQPTPFGPPVPTLHLLMEFVDGPNLEEALADNLIPEESVSVIFEEIVRSIRHLHAMDILHRDLKPGNILLRTGSESSEYTAVVTDFGECQRSTEHLTRSGNTGTIEYSAPEVIRGERYTRAADIWSLGIILYQLSTHSLPWKSLDVDFLRDKLINLEDFPIQKENIPELAVILLKEMLQVDPKKRPSADQIVKLLKEMRKSPTQPSYSRFAIISTATTLTVLFAMCYPCSINLLLLLSLFALYPMRLSNSAYLISSIFIIFYFMTFNQPCTSCHQ